MKKILIAVVVLAVAAAVFLLKKVNESEGLEWSKLASEKMNFDDAAEYCENLKEGGYSDWYLPSVAELETIGRYGASKFGDVERFWSSTQWYLRSTDSGHWDFEFSSAYNQHMSYNNSGHYVRCVTEGRYLCYQLFSVKSRFFNLFPYYPLLLNKITKFTCSLIKYGKIATIFRLKLRVCI